MDAEKNSRITAFLTAHDMSLESLPKARQAQLLKVDKAVQERLRKLSEADEVLRTCAVNVSAISADTCISRKTFYNNELLRLYVEQFASDPDDRGSCQESSRLKERNDQLAEQVQAFLLRDIETENLRHENMKLTAEIKNLENRNKTLESEYAKSVEELRKLRSQIASQSDHIIKMPSS